MGYTPANILLHIVVPVLAILDWLVVGRGQRSVRWWQPLVWLIYPAVYVVLALVVLNRAGRRAPYYFLDPDSVGMLVVVTNIGLLAASFSLWDMGFRPSDAPGEPPDRSRLSLDRVQVLRSRRCLDRGEIGVGAEHPVGCAGAGDGEPVVLVLEMVLAVIPPDRPVETGFRLVVAVDQIVGPLVSEAEHHEDHQERQSEAQPRKCKQRNAQPRVAPPTAEPSTV